MNVNEGIMFLAIGFMVIIGIWLAALTYLVLKRTSSKQEKEESTEDKMGEEEEKTMDEGLDAKKEEEPMGEGEDETEDGKTGEETKQETESKE